MNIKTSNFSHCINAERVYDWVNAFLHVSASVGIPLGDKAAIDEVCGNFTLSSQGQVSTLWESILPLNVSGSVTILITSGSLESVDILINGNVIDSDQGSIFNKTFQSLRSVEIRNKNSLLPITGRYCFTLHYYVIQDMNGSLCECQCNKCFLANECGEPACLGEVICKEIGNREEIEISLPNGEVATLEKISLCIQGFIGVHLKGRTQVCVIPFSKVEHIILCAPPGTRIHCQATHFSCRINTITRFYDCCLLEFTIDICQNIQSLADVTVEIKDVVSCLPRQATAQTNCMNSRLNGSH